MTNLTISNNDNSELDVNKFNFGFGHKVPLVLQTQSAECGLCCLAMVSGYFGHVYDLISLRNRFSVSYNGLNLKQIIQIAEKMNLNANAVKLDLEEINNLRRPCIIHWGLDHFVVLTKIKRNKVVVHDPAKGIREYSINEFSKYFTGVALELSPANKFEKTDNSSKLTLKKFTGRLVGYRSQIVNVLIISMILQIVGLAFPFYTQTVVDDVLLRNDHNLLVVLAIGYFVLMLFREMNEAVRSFMIMKMSTLINVQMGANVFRHLLRLPLSYFETREMGDVVSRFGSVNKIKEMLTTGLITAFVDGVMAITVFFMMLVYSLKLSLIVVFFVVVHILIKWASYRPLRVLAEESIAAHARKDTNFMESIKAIQSIKIFERESIRGNLWMNRYSAAINRDISAGKLNIFLGTFQGILFGMESILIIYMSAIEVMASLLTLGMLFAFLSYKEQFVSKVVSLVDIGVQFKMLNLHLERLADIVYAKPENDTSEYIKINHAIDGSISVINLSFRYSDVDPWVLRNVSFEIKSGESVAVVGSSGCGKTTLLKLMMGLLQPTEGEIVINGISIDQIMGYRSQICGVMQDDQLVSGSIADNISFNDPLIDMSRVYYSAKMSSIHKTITDMPMQYNTIIGDMGTSLSGGQKQRVILARAIYKNPKIIFLDEATSHLDLENEKSVNENISGMDITRIIIAHRPETIKSAKRVIFLEKLNFNNTDKIA